MVSEPRPRGTAGRLPWTYQVDLSFAYTPQWAEGLTAKMDVFNIFNKQEEIAVDDRREEDAATGAPVSTYLVPSGIPATARSSSSHWLVTFLSEGRRLRCIRPPPGGRISSRALDPCRTM